MGSASVGKGSEEAAPQCEETWVEGEEKQTIMSRISLDVKRSTWLDTHQASTATAFDAALLPKTETDSNAWRAARTR